MHRDGTRKRRGAALAIGAIAAAVVLARGVGSHEPATASDGPLRPEDAKAAVEKVQAKVEEIRGLKFKSAVPVSVIGDKEAKEHALARFHKFFTDADLAAMETAYRLLGLLPEKTGLMEQYLDVLGEQVGGMYDPSAKAFFLLDDMPRALAPLLAAHELTHALEDQHYDLDSRIGASKGDDDLEFAQSAVHEGSATVVMALYAARSMADGSLSMADLQALARSESGKAEKLSRMAPVLQRPLLGSYLLGGTFVLRGDLTKLVSGGFPKEDVDRAFREGPRSSEQILHPEKYWDEGKRDDPKPVAIRDLRPILGTKWKKDATGSLGELIVGALVGAPTPSGSAGLAASPSDWTNAAASGWGGDRWQLWSKDGESLVVFESVWDTDADADEFARALPADRAGRKSLRSGDRVTIVAGGAATVRKVAKALAAAKP